MAFHGELSRQLSKAIFSQARTKSWLCLYMDFIPLKGEELRVLQVPVQEELGQKSMTPF